MFQSVEPRDLTINPFHAINEDWYLISAKSGDKLNTMTASWGSLGFLWNRPIVTCYVRPQRFTYSLLQEADEFTLSFFPEGYREILTRMGRTSGYDVDKIQSSGLTPVEEEQSFYFEEAKLVLRCRKLSVQPLDPACFKDPSIERNFYPEKDYSVQFIGEIIDVLIKE